MTDTRTKLKVERRAQKSGECRILAEDRHRPSSQCDVDVADMYPASLTNLLADPILPPRVFPASTHRPRRRCGAALPPPAFAGDIRPGIAFRRAAMRFGRQRDRTSRSSTRRSNASSFSNGTRSTVTPSRAGHVADVGDGVQAVIRQVVARLVRTRALQVRGRVWGGRSPAGRRTAQRFPWPASRPRPDATPRRSRGARSAACRPATSRA